ncbi:MAG TPA: hypothetical protein VLY86_01200 [Methanothrix sp.]|nr:hypothetical protein [Methanothrix sp.]
MSKAVRKIKIKYDERRRMHRSDEKVQADAGSIDLMDGSDEDSR